MINAINASTPDDASLDALVAQVVDEFRDRQERGDTPDVEEYAARHPEAAALLRNVLATFQLLDGSLPAAPDGVDVADLPLSGTLGDFRIVREVGRGGMGIVYEAEQISLGRRIALKVLPFASTLDPRQLQRFHNEARAAASLRHEHIVAVHAVGQERGVHFFAMQFIDGQTLAALIAEQRQPEGKQESGGRGQEPGVGGQDADHGLTTAQSPAPGVSPKPAADTEPQAGRSTERSPLDAAHFRRVAEWGIQAAEALEHAHSLGIVHRDIKPGNLMIDAAGQLWVTDFGLARRAADSDLTMTGDLLGTLRYMSPEQALAKHDLVDHRSDIYSLGATLYEMLTLHPAVFGHDRQRIVNQITQVDPQNPRRWDRKIPADLETIVLKALAKEPEARYPTAKDLADDLRRHLHNEPIRARRSTVGQRVRKWARRHPAVVRSAVLLLILLTAGSSLSTWLVWHEKTRTGVALAAEKAERNRADEERKTAQAREAETKKVLDFVEGTIFAAARPEGQAGGLGPEVTLRRALEQALPLVEKSFTDQPLIEARLRRTLGLSFRYLGEEKIAAQQFQTACTLYSIHLGPDHPDTLATINNLANSYHALGRLDDALKLRKETLAQRQTTLGPNHPDTLASMNNLANSYDALGRHGKALEIRKQTLALRQANLAPDDPATLTSMNNLAISYTVLGQHQEAVKLRVETLALLQDKLVPDYARRLAAMNNLAESYHALGRYEEALPLFEDTLALAKLKLKDNHPKTLLVMNNLAWLLATAEDVTFRNPKRAVELAAKAVQLSPKNAEYSGTLGTARYRNREWKQAALDLEKAIGLRGTGDSRNANESFFLAMTRWQLGDKTGARNSFDKGVAWMDTSKSRNDEVRCFRAEAAELLGIKEAAKRPDQKLPT